MLAGVRGDGCRAQLEAPASWPIRLADDEKLIREVRDASQERNPEGSRTEERDSSCACH